MSRFHWLTVVSLSAFTFCVTPVSAKEKRTPFRSRVTQISHLQERAVPPQPKEVVDQPAGVSAYEDDLNPDFLFNDQSFDSEPGWLESGQYNEVGNYEQPVSPNWYAQYDVLFLTRNNRVSNQAVVLRDVTGDVLLRTGDLSFSRYEPGARLLLGLACDDCSAFEASYFGVCSLNATQSVLGVNNLDIPADLVVPATDFDNARAMRLDYDSRVHNFELNHTSFIYGSRPCGGVEWLAGFRYVNVHETFNINTIDDDLSVSDYKIRARNHLFGAQIGLRATHRWDRLSLSATGKAGIFGNAANQTQTVGDLGNTFLLRDTSASKTLTSFVGELNATASYMFTDHIALRAGYSAIWMQGLALAPNQLDFTNNALSGTRLNSSNGDLLLHGANIGLEFTW